jgi:prolyl 4-hydroxylase
MPYKVEIVSLEPYIEIYHQVLNDDEIETVKELATPRVRILLLD